MLHRIRIVSDDLSKEFIVIGWASKVYNWLTILLSSFRLQRQLNPADCNLVLELIYLLKVDLLKLLQEGKTDHPDAI